MKSGASTSQSIRHTPGPWEWRDNKHGERRLFGPDNTPVIGVRDCCTHTNSEAHVEVWSEEDERLIASAPALLAALAKARCSYCGFVYRANPKCPDAHHAEAFAALRAAGVKE